MKKLKIGITAMLLILFSAVTVHAHFGMVIPSDTMVMQGDNRSITLDLSFSHPFESIGMELVKPSAFKVFFGKNEIDLLGSLKDIKIMDQKAWSADFKINRPGVYIFYMQPEPYWEETEDCYIIHHTKTIIGAFGIEEGWDEPIGVKTEIVPLTRPFGLYTGNIFQGMVLLDGKPVPNCDVEVEYYNKNRRAVAVTDYMVTQVVKTDKNGIFSYAAPKSGWWGFAGLNSSDKKMKYKGEEKDIELGAILWVRFIDWTEKQREYENIGIWE